MSRMLSDHTTVQNKQGRNNIKDETGTLKRAMTKKGVKLIKIRYEIKIHK